jgi:hypothetical protein
MSLDLRIPMGLMFTLTGLILTLFGYTTRANTELYVKSLGINVNLWWGLVLLAFGLTMFLMGQRRQRRLASSEPKPADKSGAVRRGH